MKVERVTGSDLDAVLDDLAALRIAVFRDWPYLYDGDLTYERAYVEHYRASYEAAVIIARDGSKVVGAATAAPLAAHASEFGTALDSSGIDATHTFYCGESVLLPGYRGRGIGHTFFDQREAHARTLGYKQMCFCAVIRPDDHPLRPDTYRPLDGFWTGRGYAPVPGAVARFRWKDVDQTGETEKRLQFWLCPL